MTRAAPVRVVSAHSLSAGPRFADLVRLPTWMVAGGVVLRWCARHPRTTGVVVASIWLRVKLGSWWLVTVALALIAAAICGGVLVGTGETHRRR